MRSRSSLLLLAVLATACATTAPVSSYEPTPPPAAQSIGKTEVTWWGHAAWIIKTPAGTTIALDPWLTNPKAPKDAKWPDKLDAILVTHGHFDHVGDTVKLAQKTGAEVIGCYELVSQLGVAKPVGANSGGTIKVKDVTIHLVPAVHSSGYSADGKSPPVYGGLPLGYVIEIKDGPTIYDAGDTDAFQDMVLIHDRYNPTIAMLPIGGWFTMDPQGAALAARLLEVDTVIPMHFGTFPVLSGTPGELRTALQKMSPTTKVLEFHPGETKLL